MRNQPGFDDANAVVHLSADLAQVDVWAPPDWYSLSASDADLGSIGPLLLDGGRVFVAGKNGVGYVLNAGHLGGIGGEVDNRGICDGGAFGGSATDGSTVVVGCSGGPVGVKIGADGTISAVWHGPGDRSGAPVIAGSSAWLGSNSGHLFAIETATGSVQADIKLGDRVPGSQHRQSRPTRSTPQRARVCSRSLGGDDDRHASGQVRVSTSVTIEVIGSDGVVEAVPLVLSGG